MSLKLTL